MAAVAYPSNAKSVLTSRNLTYSYALFPPSKTNAKTIVFLHGFPSTAADWSSQITHLTAQGYGALAIDMLGYGGSSKPDDPSYYGMKHMACDIVDVLNHEGLQKVHFVAHDAGTGVLSILISFHAERCVSATFIGVGFATPDRPWDRDKVAEICKRVLGWERFGYLDFIAREDSWEMLDAHPESMACGVLGPNKRYEFYPPGALEKWLQEDRKIPYPPWVRADWSDASRRATLLGNGYRGPTNWARASAVEAGKLSVEELKLFKENGRVKVPVLEINAAYSDVSLPPAPMDAYLADYRRAAVSTTGHWIQLEAAQEVNMTLTRFLSRYG